MAILGTLLGAKNYSLLRNLVAPENPKDKTYNELVEKLKAHFEPKPLVIAERFNFYRRVQASGESVADFVAALRQLARKCEFGTFLDQAIRDKLVCGLRSESIQRKLLTEEGLTTSRAVEIAQGMESATTKAREIKESGGQVNRVFNRKKPASEGGSKASAPPTKPASIPHNDVSCFRCGRKGHSVHKCPFKDSKCHKCGKIGHLRVVCRSKTSKSGRDSTGQVAKTQWMCAPDCSTARGTMFNGSKLVVVT